MVLDGDQAVARLVRGREERRAVDRLNGVGIDHAQRDPLRGEQVVRLERLEQRDAGGDHGRRVVRGLAHHLRAADRERLVRAVDDRRRGARRPNVRHAVVAGRRFDEAGGAHRIARIQHGAAGDGAHHRQVFERHLGRAVLADRHAGMRSGERDVHPTDSRHPNEVGGAHQERGKRRRERDGAAAREAHRHAGHHLLGNVGLVEPVGMRRFEVLAEGGVADVGVERHDARVGVAEGGERGAVRGARRHLVAERVRGRLRQGRRAAWRRRGRLGARWRRRDRGRRRAIVQYHADIRERGGELIAGWDRLAVPAVLSLEEGNALPLQRARQNHRRASAGARRLVEGVDDLPHVVAVHDNRMPAERVPPRTVGVHVVAPLRRAALTEAVDVGDGAEVVERVPLCHLRRFPDRALCRLTVANEHIRAVVGADPPRVQRNADRGADPLAERARRDVDERQPRRRVAFKVGIDRAEIEQLVRRHVARFRPDGVEEWCGVSLRQDEAIVLVVLRVARVEAHLRKEERGDDVGGGATA